MTTATSTAVPRHPAKFSDSVLEEIYKQVKASKRAKAKAGITGPMRVLDPFAGVGKIHRLDDLKYCETVGVELEPEWAAADPRTVVGDALALPFPDKSFTGVITSPCYGNRMADHHEAKDTSKRNTYRHALGRMPTTGSAAIMQWGPEYRVFHREAIEEMIRVSQIFMMISMSDHIRKNVVQPVVAWWVDTLAEYGCTGRTVKVATPRLRHGANHDVRVAGEALIMVKVP